ncbi:MAG: 2-amino-4-hydroxy-6-hydroxymethyldihydropteridine diphosphokinase [Spirochaetales bacterium]|nr:2-amino-4-hydroxy-6-hydroxymethyldihydropteridine diphosphokinase [Spirochaetales bacterium]
MDKLIIKDLEVYGFHGFEPEVDKSGEKYIISAELSLNLKEAGDTDRLKNTVNLVKICREIADLFTHNQHKLIESCAEELAEYILLTYPVVNHVSVSINKPWIPAGMTIKYAGITIERKWHTAYLGIGTNLGERMTNIQSAIDMINESKFCRVTNQSKIYETEPYGYLDQDKFLNGALEVKTLLTPRSFLRFLLDVEKKLKRERIIHYGPRTMDLDVLFYDQIMTSFEEAVIPHPRLHERMFVMKPLCDIAPYYVHPILNERCYRIAEELMKTENEPEVWKEDRV